MAICLNCRKLPGKPKFCCSSCSAIFNNKAFPKRSPEYKYRCLTCNTPVIKNRYCSAECRKTRPSKKQVLLLQCLVCKKELMTRDPRRKTCSALCRKLSCGRHKPIDTETIKRARRGQESKKVTRRVLAFLQKDKCATCTRKTWLGNPIPLELHHIDGNSGNWRFKNLQLLCPNCHAQTENYKSKNRGRGRGALRGETCL